MKRVTSCVLAGAALLAFCTVTRIANASTIHFVADHGSGLSAYQAGNQGIIGNVISVHALTLASDWIEFYVTPAGTNTTVTVNDLANTHFPNEKWEITGPGGFNTGLHPANNVPTSITIPLGGSTHDYFLRLLSGAPLIVGASSFSLTVPSSGGRTPLPGALGLFAGGLGLLSATRLARRKKQA